MPKSALAAPPVKTLAQAIAQNDATAAARMLSSEASLDEPVAGWNAPPLIVAAASGATKVTELLLAKGAAARADTHASAVVDDLDDTGVTALHVAAHAGHPQVVDALLTSKRDLITTLSAKKRNALYFAARPGHVAVVDVLLRHAADMKNQFVTPSESALSVAAKYGHLECVQALLDRHNVDVHKTNRDGSTALHQAAAKGHVDVIAALLAHEARIDDADIKGLTPLHWSAMSGQAESARVLLEHNADVNASSEDGLTAVRLAAVKGHIDVAQALLDANATVTRADVKAAKEHGHTQVAKLLKPRAPSALASLFKK